MNSIECDPGIWRNILTRPKAAIAAGGLAIAALVAMDGGREAGAAIPGLSERVTCNIIDRGVYTITNTLERGFTGTVYLEDNGGNRDVLYPSYNVPAKPQGGPDNEVTSVLPAEAEDQYVIFAVDGLGETDRILVDCLPNVEPTTTTTEPDTEPTTTVPSTLVTTTTVPAPTTTSAPTTTAPAPTTTLPAPSSTIGNTSTTAPAPTTTLPAPSSTIGNTSTTALAPSTTIQGGGENKGGGGDDGMKDRYTSPTVADVNKEAGTREALARTGINGELTAAAIALVLLGGVIRYGFGSRELSSSTAGKK